MFSTVVRAAVLRDTVRNHYPANVVTEFNNVHTSKNTFGVFIDEESLSELLKILACNLLSLRLLLDVEKSCKFFELRTVVLLNASEDILVDYVNT